MGWIGGFVSVICAHAQIVPSYVTTSETLVALIWGATWAISCNITMLFLYIPCFLDNSEHQGRFIGFLYFLSTTFGIGLGACWNAGLYF